MIRTIFHQLWNQRRQNGWIFIELLAVSFFLWTVLDPVYVLTANYHIDRGYDERGVYVVQMGTYDETYGNYDASLATDSLSREFYLRALRTICQQPEVDSYCVVTAWSFPNSSSWSGMQVYPDTASAGKSEGYEHAQRYEFIVTEGSNPFRTFGMRDAHTGREVRMPEDIRDKVFLSEYLARKVTGSADATGKKVYTYDKHAYEVAGVLCDYKHRDYQQPYPLLVSLSGEIKGGSYMGWMYVPVIRLKKNADPEAFEQRFCKEVIPQLSVGNFYCSELKPFSQLSDEYAARSGVTNKLRLQYSLTGFTILCIFLGMVGTFWIRCNARRQEIGVMCSMGASRGTICRQFLTEAWLLVTVAFVLVLPLLWHHARIDGMYVVEVNQNFVPDLKYAQNRFGAHFGIVTLLSYLLLLAVALVGTYIPVKRAARILPAEALRDE